MYQESSGGGACGTPMSNILDSIIAQVAEDKRKTIDGLLEFNPDAKLLDCGCSNGGVTVDIADKIGTRKLYGIEILGERVVLARSKGVLAYKGNLNNKFPFRSNNFDMVLAGSIIEHLPNTDKFVKEIYRVLRPGGYAIIQTPNLAALYNILYLIVGKQPYIAMVSDELPIPLGWPLNSIKAWTRGHPQSHQRLFTPGALKALLEFHGLKVEKLVNSGFLPFPPVLWALLCKVDPRHATNITIKVRKPKGD